MHRKASAWLQRIGFLAAASAPVFCGAGQAVADDAAVASFYKGKNITILVGSSAGGGYDTYARLVARHMSKHMPGNPTVIVSNMPGAGSNVAANFIYNAAPKDGTMIGALYGGSPLEPLIGTTPVQHDPSKSQFLGSANNDVYVCVARKDAPAKSIEDVLKMELLAGASTSSSTSDFPAILNAVIGTKFKMVLGYPGSREIGLAIDKGEVLSACGFAWPSISVTNAGWFGEKGTMRVILQTHVKGHAELNAMGVPNAMSYAKTDEQRAMLELFFAQQVFGRPYVVAPQVPKDRVEALRKAFWATLKDPELLADAKRANLEVDPVSADDVQALIAKIYASPREITEKIKKALQPN